MKNVLKFLQNPFLLFLYPSRWFVQCITLLPHFRFIRQTRGSDVAISFQTWFLQKVIGINRHAYWPMHHSSIAGYVKNVHLGINTFPGINPGCYIHAVNKIYIGDYTQFGPNTGLLSGNHDYYNFRLQTSDEPIRIGNYCWVGMNAIILPGVTLGDFTIVAAGAVVTHSFPEGKCIVAGVPAKKIKDLEADKCIPIEMTHKFNGYIETKKFEKFRKNNLNV